MLKKRNFIVLIVYLAGAMLLGHNFFPHHHDNSVTEKATSHQGHDHHHHGEFDSDEHNPDYPSEDFPQHSKSLGYAIVKQSKSLLGEGCDFIFLVPELVNIPDSGLPLTTTIQYKTVKSQFLSVRLFLPNVLRGPPAPSLHS